MASLIISIVFIFTVISGADIVVFERFIGIQQELQGMAQIRTSFDRTILWEIASSLIARDPLGYGPGGAIHYLKSDVGLYFDENNFHNIAIQFSVDGGIISGIAYSVFAFSVIINSIKRRLSNPIDICVLIYILSDLVQWTGYDPMGWVFIGIYSAMSREIGTGVERERQ
jgi:O-antigen ligase